MSSTAPPSPTKSLLKTVALLTGISFAAGIFYADWSERNAKYEAANTAVLAHADSAVSSAFSHWTETMPSVSELTPALVLEGASSVVIAIARDEPPARFLFEVRRPAPTWSVLARSHAGRYFIVRFTLDTAADPDSAHAGWRRLIAESGEVTERKAAMDWLYRRGLRKEYEGEFNEVPPPEKIAG